MKAKIIISLIFFIVFSFLIQPAIAFYCGNKIVSEGNTDAEVFLKCGEPFWKEEYIEVIVSDVDTSFEKRSEIRIEKWTYNFGPTKLLYILTFRNGKLRKITTDGYGFLETPLTDECDRGRRIHKGDTLYEVLRKCGKPTWHSTRRVSISEPLDERTERKVLVTIEELTYNFGPGNWLYLLRFENGRLVKIETRGYGY